MSLRFRPRRRIIRRLPPGPPLLVIEDVVHLRGFDFPLWFVETNARQIMAGFDELPKKLRDQINYAPTPELGARAVSQLVAEGDLLTRTKSRR